jgi:transposase-like protein
MSDADDNFNADIIFSNDQKLKLIQLINEGGQVLSEVETLNEGLNDTIKAVAEEMNIKASILKRAVRIAHKMEYGKTQREQSLLDNILTTAGKTL